MATNPADPPRPSHSPSSSITTGPHTEEIVPGNAAKNNSSNSLQKLDSRVIDVKAVSELDKYKHLSLEETAVIKRQLDVPEVKLDYFDLFRYATFNDKLLLFTAGLTATVAGAVLPLMTVVFGALAGVFQKWVMMELPPDEFQSELNKYTLCVTRPPLPLYTWPLPLQTWVLTSRCISQILCVHGNLRICVHLLLYRC